MGNKLEVSLIIPVFNEQEVIEETVRICLNALADIFNEYELIIVDDASTDDTHQILKKLRKEYPQHLKVITSKKNSGSGRSLLKGFARAKYAFIATNFADRPFNTEELKFIMPLFENKIDFVVVCRKDRLANSIYRKLTSITNYYLIKLLFRVRISDFQFVQVYRRNMLYNIKVNASGTFVPPELMIRGLAAGYRYLEYKTIFHARKKGRAKCGHPKVILRTIFDMCIFWFKFKKHA